MQPEVLRAKRQSEDADVKQVEITKASQEIGKPISRQRLCLIFRDHAEATQGELEAIREGLRAAIQAKDKKLRTAMPEAFAATA